MAITFIVHFIFLFVLRSFRKCVKISYEMFDFDLTIVRFVSLARLVGEQDEAKGILGEAKRRNKH